MSGNAGSLLDGPAQRPEGGEGPIVVPDLQPVEGRAGAVRQHDLGPTTGGPRPAHAQSARWPWGLDPLVSGPA